MDRETRELIRKAWSERQLRMLRFDQALQRQETRRLKEAPPTIREGSELRLNRAQVVSLSTIAYDNLTDSRIDIPLQDEDGTLWVEVTSPTVPKAKRIYSLPPTGGVVVEAEDAIIEGLLQQDTEEPEE